MRPNFKLDYINIHKWELYSANIKDEFRQLLDEGKNVVAYQSIVDTIAGLPAGEFRERLADTAFREFCRCEQEAGYKYIEPSDLEGINSSKPGDNIHFQKPEKNDILLDKIYGAWLGRVCGCLLGKPIEGWKSPQIISHLKKTGNYPLSRYIVNTESDTQPFINNIKGYAPFDDDTNYTVMYARLIEKYGRDFTSANVAQLWIDEQCKNAYCTAERVAYINYINGIRPPETATYKNAFREWIGAQIRGDYFGYINPGDPEMAAEMAWRDGIVSHVKNGIYGEMFVAAMLAVAAVSCNVKTVIHAGLSQIPQKSRLYESITEVLSWYDWGLGAAECFAKIHEAYDENNMYCWTHTIPNAMIVVVSLLYGGLDFGKSICMAVETGYDTDCNGATVGSVIGMMTGTAGIPKEWTDPICGRLETTLLSVGTVDIKDMAELTMKHII